MIEKQENVERSMDQVYREMLRSVGYVTTRSRYHSLDEEQALLMVTYLTVSYVGQSMSKRLRKR